jgi:hypothetical protein
MRISGYFVVLVSLALAACSGSAKPAPAVVSVPPAADETGREDLQPGAWFQPNGSIVVVDTSGRSSPELSAPLVPCVTALNKDGFYPPGREEQERMADEASLTFPYFLDACAKRYPLVRPSNGQTLTPEQGRDNYANVARCAYETHYGKPYWVPQLIDDVDLCERALGRGWHLPNRESLGRFNAEHRARLYQALKNVPFGGGYDSILMYARAEDGKLTLIDLAPAAARERGSSLPQLPAQPKLSFQAAALSLRCTRESRALPTSDLPPVRAEAASCGELLAVTMTAQGPKLAAAQPVQPVQPVPAQADSQLDPVIVRLSAHAQALDENPDSFNPKVTLREVERAAAVAKKAYAGAPDSQQPSQAELAKLAQRYQELRQKLEDPQTPASERPALTAEFQTLHVSLITLAQEGFGPRITPEQKVVQQALRAISALNHARFRRAYPEYKHWVALGRPMAGKRRSLAAIEQEVAALRKLEQKLDDIRGTNAADSLMLPPKSAFKKK